MIKLLQLSYSGYAEDNFCIFYSQYFFQTTHDRYLLSKIKLVLSPTLYKFIIWACWAKTQSCLGSKPKPVLIVSIQHMWIFVYIVINEFYLSCRIFYLLLYVPKIFFLSYSFVMLRIDFLLIIWVNLHIYIDIVHGK